MVPTLGDEQRLPREVSLVEIEDDIDAVDAVDADLFPVFEEEAQELLPQLAAAIRAWSDAPNDHGQAHQAMRILHTFKGGARIAGAMRVGEVAHRLETAIEQRLAAADHASLDRHDIEPLQARVDVIQTWFEQLIQDDTQRYAAEQAQAEATAAVPLTAGSVMAEAAHTKALHAELSADPLPDLGELPTLDASLPQPVPASAPSAPAPASVDLADPVPAAAPVAGTSKALAVSQAGLQAVNWGRFERAPGTADLTPVQRAVNAQSSVRVRSQLLDRLVNQAGEVSITRARLESDMGQIKGSLRDLTDNLDRLRGQLRDIELQAETQITARMERAKAEGESFDPLEMDRFTRFQELTRMMAESVNDVGTVQRTLQRTLETAEDELAMQARLTRNLQDDLLRTRMSEFESLTERLYRVVRQASKETGKQVRLDLVGGGIEVDRGVLERMVGSFEHILRNSVTHGIESAEQRELLGKSPVGQITVSVAQEGNEVSVEFRDDGAGLNLARIREKAVAAGMLSADAQPTDGELAQFIFMPGFSTADRVSELAGRGVGMDVVRTEVNAMGGRIETASAPQRGTSFRLILPLTTAVTQVVMLRCGPLTIGVPATLVEVVRRAKPAELEAHYQSGSYTMGEQQLPFFWLGALLQSTPVGLETGRSLPVVVIRSANQRVAVHVDEVLGSQEVVVKNLGPQLSRLPGLAGMTLLASGAVALIYNPVALATVYGPQARGYSATALAAGWRVASGDLLQLESKAAAGQVPLLETQPELPLVLVVDDSLTVRRVTQRLLVREGYRVVLAKDGLDALEKLAQDLPHVVLSDIEMPRMDGFDLVRNIRGDERTKDLPVIMITSRIAQKHRDYAAELGVNHYLGKPYDEEHLLSLIAHFTQAQGAADGRA
ncbi:MAG: hybrid sensor histidine kinase/response regulator [Burkholderiaceae bacterium]|nr:MAG: hybrid sensor histidine kinase/response regulator [Burkholderiaceae bacterium]